MYFFLTNRPKYNHKTIVRTICVYEKLLRSYLYIDISANILNLWLIPCGFVNSSIFIFSSVDAILVSRILIVNLSITHYVLWYSFA